jgi:hypothetical protein
LTIGSSYSFDLNLAGLVRVALQRASVLGLGDEPQPAEVTAGGEFLNLLLKSWQAASRLLRNVEMVTTTLTAGTATVTLAADTIDVEFPCSVKLTTGDHRYQVERMTLDEYQMLSDLTEEGIPTKALVQRAATVSMTLWPIPTSTVESITYTRVKLVKDILSGETADVQQRYLNALGWGLAAEFAEVYRMPMDKVDRLTARYQEERRNVHRDNAERGHIKFSLR